jgi:hypothetical protein
MFGKESVEDRNEEDNGNAKESSMPSFVDVVGVIQHNESLNLGTSQKGADTRARLPA